MSIGEDIDRCFNAPAHVLMGCMCLEHLVQASMIAEELLKHNPDVVRIVYNKFRSAISFKPTVATVLLPEVSGSKAGTISVYGHQLCKQQLPHGLPAINCASSVSAIGCKGRQVPLQPWEPAEHRDGRQMQLHGCRE